MAEEPSRIDLNAAVANGMVIHTNLNQEVIVTNTDKVRLLLISHHNIIKRRNDWIAPVGIFITILATILTASFDKQFLGLAANTWQTVFLIALIVFFIWSLISVFFALSALSNRKGTVDEFIEKLKIESTN